MFLPILHAAFSAAAAAAAVLLTSGKTPARVVSVRVFPLHAFPFPQDIFRWHALLVSWSAIVFPPFDSGVVTTKNGQWKMGKAN